MVSTGNPSQATASELTTTAIRKPGSLGASLRNAIMMASAPTPTATVAPSIVEIASR